MRIVEQDNYYLINWIPFLYKAGLACFGGQLCNLGSKSLCMVQKAHQDLYLIIFDYQTFHLHLALGINLMQIGVDDFRRT